MCIQAIASTYTMCIQALASTYTMCIQALPITKLKNSHLDAIITGAVASLNIANLSRESDT